MVLHVTWILLTMCNKIAELVVWSETKWVKTKLVGYAKTNEII